MKNAANAISVARDALFPWSQAINPRGKKRYPGAFYGMLELMEKQAAFGSVRDWIRGARPAPKWVVKLLWDELERRIERERQAQIMLENYQGGPGTGCGLIAYHKKKRAAQHEAAQKHSAKEN